MIMQNGYVNNVSLSQRQNTSQHSPSRPAASIESILRTNMGDAGFLLEKIEAMSKDGSNKLQVISDFDFTISRYEVDGCLQPSTHAIEHDSSQIDASQVYSYMEEWWERSLGIFEQIPLSLQLLRDCNAGGSIQCRPQFVRFTRQLQANGIPMTIFSAGVSNLISNVLTEKRISLDGIDIVANFIEFEESVQKWVFNRPLIHSANKNFATLKLKRANHSFPILSRPNVILLGDSEHDVNMVDQSTFANVIRIGWLNRQSEKNLEKYLNVYDIVLPPGSSFETPRLLLDYICAKTVK